MIRVLLVSDSPFLGTGFGTLSRRIGSYLYTCKDIDLAHCALSDPRKNDSNIFNKIEIPWQVYKYNGKNFKEIENAYRPDAVIMITDMWKTVEFLNTDAAKVYLAHIEGEPLPSKIYLGTQILDIPKLLLRMNYIIPAGPYADRIIRERLRNYVDDDKLDEMMPVQIPDCIDMKLYKPMGKNWKRKIFNLEDDNFLVGWFGRQNPRKGLPYLMEGFAKWDNPNKKLYIHTALKDPYGWDLFQLIHDLDIEDSVIVNPKIRLNKGVTEEDMARLYNACDITVQPSLGEGFGLTILESLACGNRVAINKYAELERFNKCCVTMEPKAFYVEPRTNIRRAIPDVDLITQTLQKLYENPKQTSKEKRSLNNILKKTDIKSVGKQWEGFIKKSIKERPKLEVAFDEKKQSVSHNDPVSIIIPTKNNYKDIVRCVRSIKENTKHPYEIIIVDTESTDKNAIEYYRQEKGIRIINRVGKHNYSDECNIGVKHAQHELICIMNDDVFVHRNWLTEMLKDLENEFVGIVGPKLLFENGLIQHAGVKLIRKTFTHPYIGQPRNYPLANFTRDVQGVTGACFVTKKSLYEKVDGMDTELDVECQDFDLCLKIHKAGYRIVYTPHSEAIHLVASNRGNKWPDRIRANRETFLQRWHDYLFSMEYHNKGPENILISIIVPIYNCESYIAPFLKSVRAQTYENYEIILVNDGSIDSSKSTIDKFRMILPDVRVIHHDKNTNANVARMSGFTHALGEYIIFSDVDSKWEPNLLEEYLMTLLQNPKVSYVYADHYRRGFINDTWKTIDFDPRMLLRTNFINMISLIRKPAFPGLNPELERAQDWDLWLRMLKDKKIGKHVSKILYTLYMRENGISGRGDKDWFEWRKIVLDEYHKPKEKNYVDKNKTADLEIIMAIKDLKHRGYERLYNNLYSLSIQTIRPKKITIMDGSDDKEYQEVHDIINKFDFVEHVHHKLDIFNKPLLYNIGLKNVKTKYVLMTDADYVYEQDFIETVITYLNKTPDSFILCQTTDLPSTLELNEKRIKENYSHIRSKGTPHPLYGDGACQATLTEWFHKVRGYDERMARLGAMDNDMHRRAVRYGLKVIWVNQNKSSILHQWHEKTKWRTLEQKAQHEKNKKIFNEDKTIIRNNDKWGEV